VADSDDDELQLYREISPKERLDSILESRNMTGAQAVTAMAALHRENQATFPHAIVVTVMAHKAIDSEELVPVVSYVGPFRDRRAAEAWAANRWAENSRVSWEAVKMVTSELFEADARRLRAIADGTDDPRD
jgi:hypothetical protein